LIRNHSKLGQELTLEGWCLYLACPTGTSHWDKHNLSQWDRQIGTSCACPVGQAQLVPTGTGKGQKRPLFVPWDKSYTHAGGLSLSRDKLYTHDGTCPSSTCPNSYHKVGLQGRGNFPLYSQHFTTPLVALHHRRECLVALHDTLHESTPQTTEKNTVKRKLKRESSRERDNVVHWKTKRKIKDDLQCN